MEADILVGIGTGLSFLSLRYRSEPSSNTRARFTLFFREKNLWRTKDCDPGVDTTKTGLVFFATRLTIMPWKSWALVNPADHMTNLPALTTMETAPTEIG
ncbi:MAG: hypothetical protein NXH83_01765 [Rhodobacteraceae bacterium]|nr:hypothetical protein [Paracoccaceae bacterium]